MVKIFLLVMSVLYFAVACVLILANSFTIWLDDGKVEAYTWLIKAGLLSLLLYIVVVFVIPNWNKIYRKFAG